jgi:hypothetical protein
VAGVFKGASNTKIQTRPEYLRLGHTLGWRFLTVPLATFSPGTHVAFVSLNPGGSTIPPDHPSASCEAGSAYYQETWGTYLPGRAPLQLQVQGMCSLMQRIIGDALPLGEFIACRVLSAYLVPFRSPSLAALPRRRESLEFSRRIWADLLSVWTPHLVITIDREAYNCLAALLSRNGALPSEHRGWPSGWGSYECESDRYDSGMTLARLPHLSRFGLFNRAASAAQMDALMSYLAEALRT